MKNLSKDLAEFIAVFIQNIEVNRLKRKEENFDRFAELKRKELITGEELDVMLKEMKSNNDRKLKALELEKNYQLKKLEEKYEQELSIYLTYLASLDNLKVRIEKSFPDTPEPLVLMIYHHSTVILHDMWEAKDKQGRIKAERRLAEMMMMIGEDIRCINSDEEQMFLPTKALEFIKEDEYC